LGQWHIKCKPSTSFLGRLLHASHEIQTFIHFSFETNLRRDIAYSETWEVERRSVDLTTIQRHALAPLERMCRRTKTVLLKSYEHRRGGRSSPRPWSDLSLGAVAWRLGTIVITCLPGPGVIQGVPVPTSGP
jgi:hypothetical protein